MGTTTAQGGGGAGASSSSHISTAIADDVSGWIIRGLEMKREKKDAARNYRLQDAQSRNLELQARALKDQQDRQKKIRNLMLGFKE
jgi:hypothetical protein